MTRMILFSSALCLGLAASMPGKAIAREGVRAAPATTAVSRARAAVETANREATLTPEAGGFINGFQYYPFANGRIYRLLAAPERLTDIMLEPGEALISVASGDTLRWIIGDTSSGSGEARSVHILVKPSAPGLVTNLLITTDRRAYHLLLESTQRTALAGIGWTYPADALLALSRREAAARDAEPVARGISPEALHFGYVISGDRPAWRPLRAFDDGQQTYIEFPQAITVGDAPPLFLLGTDGEAELVNYRMRGRFYVVDRIFDRAELRLGKGRQVVVRIGRVPELRREKGAGA